MLNLDRSLQLHSVDDFGGWKICSAWLVPGEELVRDEFDVVLEEILASDPKLPVALPHQKSTVQYDSAK